MMSDNNITISIAADSSGVAAGMANAQQAVADGLGNMQTAFKSMGAGIASASSQNAQLITGQAKAMQQGADQCLVIENNLQTQRTSLFKKGSDDRDTLLKKESKKLETAWAGSFTKMLQGNASFSATLSSMWTGLVNSIISQIATITAQWVIALLLQKDANSKKILEDAKTAATGAFSWGSHIGGPILGAVSAAAAFAGTMAFASAAGGYDIPAGINPLTQLHEREMVLPASHADVIRNLADSNNSGGGGGTNITIHAVDAVSVRRLFQTHGSALVSALKGQNRNFAVL